jgi:RNA polymerase sigma-70 factor (ECF subfamily)
VSVEVVDLDEVERDLVARMRRGDAIAFERFADAYVPPLFRYATAHLDRDRDLVPDVVQTVVARALDKLDGFRGDGPLLAWLCVSCRNEIAGIYRKRARRPAEVPLGEPEGEPAREARAPEPEGPEAMLLASETRTLVHVALDRLPVHYARALEWKYFEGAPVVEIARRLESTPKAAESLLSRARESFREVYRSLGALASADAAELPRRSLGGVSP